MTVTFTITEAQRQLLLKTLSSLTQTDSLSGEYDLIQLMRRFNGSSPRLPPSMEPIYIRLAQRIKELRLKTGMTQRTLASKVGLSRVSIVNIEAARQRVSLVKAEQIASALGVQLSELN